MNRIAALSGARGDAGPALKRFRNGTHRTVAPDATIARMRALMLAMGITRVANVTGLDCIGVPVVMVCRPNSRSVAVSQGKGLTLDAAKASGLMESAETWHAERIDWPLKLGSYEELRRTHPLADVDALPPMAGSRFHRNYPILWIEGYELASADTCWLPYEIVHTNYTLPLPGGSGCFASSSNGLASGNHLLEAIVHGVCEVIERDATSLWHQLPDSRRGQSRIDLSTVADPACREVLDKIVAAGLMTAAWDTTTDVGVAAIYCTITDREAADAHPGVGAGCHPSREVALLRALLEAVQVRTTYISGSRDDLPRSEYTPHAMARKMQQIEAYLALGEPCRDFSDLPTREADTFEEDIDWLLGRLRDAAIENVVVVDLTRPAWNVPVARVVIPGLEGPHDDDRYLPGRRAAAAMQSP